MMKAMKYVMLSVFFSTMATAQSLSLSDVQRRLYGENLSAPAAESDIGKYIAETNAAWVVRQFPNAPEGSEIPKYAMGPQKLVVAVSPETFPIFQKYFMNSNYLYHFYEPNSMQMVAAFEGKRGTEGRLHDDMIYTVPGTLMTPILLDSDEGDRAREFFKLADMDTRTASDPWRLRSKDGQSYSAISAFQGCTHWFGGMPIGNAVVDAYVFPSGGDDVNGEKPNQKPLVEYELAGGYPQEFADQIRKVWKVQGQQQLGEMLKPDAFRRGELANTGWIAYTLLGSVSTDRVPVVFLMVEDETQALSADFSLQISAN